MAEKRAMLVNLGTLAQAMTRTKREYLAAIAGAGYASFRKAENVPTVDEAEADVLYLVRDSTSELFGIWTLIDGAVEKIGETSVNLEGYVTRDELTEAVQSAVKAALTEDLVASDDEVAEMIADIFGESGDDGMVATEEEVAEMFRDVFGY